MTEARPFVHLHLHDCHTPLEGMGKADDYLAMAKEMGHPAIAITNTGNLFSTAQWWFTAKKQGVKVLIGEEFYLSESDDMKSKDSHRQNRIVVIAKNSAGWEKLYRMSTAAYMVGRYYKPRIDTNFLCENAGDLVVLSCGLNGPIGSLFKTGNERAGLDMVKKLMKAFGDDFYLEIMPHAGSAIRELNQFYENVSRLTGAKAVVANDCRYPTKEQAQYFKHLLAIRDLVAKRKSKPIDIPDTYFYREYKDMFNELVGQGFDEALVGCWMDQTLAVADSVDVVKFDTSFKLPSFSIEKAPFPTGVGPVIEQDLDQDDQLEMGGA